MGTAARAGLGTGLGARIRRYALITGAGLLIVTVLLGTAVQRSVSSQIARNAGEYGPADHLTAAMPPGAQLYPTEMTRDAQAGAAGKAGLAASPSTGDGGDPSPAGTPVSERALIRSGELTASAADPFAAADRVSAYASSMGGLVAFRSDRSPTAPRPGDPVVMPAGGVVKGAPDAPQMAIYPAPSPRKQSVLTLRVPERRLDHVIERIKADKDIAVEGTSLQTSDATDQLVDLGARLRAKRVEEARYLALLERATRVEDILSISRTLSSVQTEIERLDAQAARIKDQVAMATLSVIISEPAQKTTPPAPKGFSVGAVLADAFATLGRNAEVALEAIIRFLVGILPLALGAALFIGVRALRRRR